MKDIKSILLGKTNQYNKSGEDLIKNLEVLKENNIIREFIDNNNLDNKILYKNLQTIIKFNKYYNNTKIKHGFNAKLVLNEENKILINIYANEEYKFIEDIKEKLLLYNSMELTQILKLFNSIHKSESLFLKQLIYGLPDTIKKKFISFIKDNKQMIVNGTNNKWITISSFKDIIRNLFIYMTYLYLIRNRNVIFCAFPEINNRFKYSTFGDKYLLINRLKECDVLVVQDFTFEETNTLFKDEILYEILNNRSYNNKPSFLHTIYDLDIKDKNINPNLQKILSLFDQKNEIFYL